MCPVKNYVRAESHFKMFVGLLQVAAEVTIGCIDVSVAGSQAFIVVANSVAHVCNSPDGGAVAVEMAHTEKKCGVQVLFRLDAGNPQGIGRTEIDVVHNIVGSMTDRKGLGQLKVFFRGKVVHN